MVNEQDEQAAAESADKNARRAIRVAWAALVVAAVALIMAAIPLSWVDFFG